MDREEVVFSELMQAFFAEEGKRMIEENERLKADPAADVPKSMHDKAAKLLSEM